MYHQKLAVAVQHRGRTLREVGDAVFLPFGSEYSILLKNLNTVKAAATVEIDGENVAEGLQLIVEPNGTLELERFIKHGNLDRGNRFKFIKRTADVERARGIRLDDGIVRVEYWFEKAAPTYVRPSNPWVKPGPIYPRPPWFDTPPWDRRRAHPGFFGDGSGYGGTKGSSLGSGTLGSGTLGAGAPVGSNAGSGEWVRGLNDVGITAPGSISNQQFTPVYGLNLEDTSHVMVLRLLGEAKDAQVTRPHTTRTRLTCINCRQSNRPGHQFCSRCGTGLVIV